jgi:hypothetical protein
MPQMERLTVAQVRAAAALPPTEAAAATCDPGPQPLWPDWRSGERSSAAWLSSPPGPDEMSTGKTIALSQTYTKEFVDAAQG